MLCIVVLDKSYGILLIVTVGRKRLFVPTQPTPIAIVDGVSNPITELEIEGRTRRILSHITLRIVHPLLDFISTVPIFANAKSWLRKYIIIGYEGGPKAFHHIIAKT